MSKSTDDLIWADEVMLVYKNLGLFPGSRSLESPSANHLLQWAQQEANATKFLADLVPKATAILAKHRPVSVDDAVVEMDKKTIGELQVLLRDAVGESHSFSLGKPSENPPETYESLDDFMEC